MPEAAVEFRNLSVSATPSVSPHRGREGVAASPRPILPCINLEIETGTTVALLGRSGSGKTTLLRTVNGLVLPTAGEVHVLGQTIVTGSAPASLIALRHSIGYVIQETGLYPHMSIERNVALPLELAGTPGEQRRGRSAELLSAVGLDPARYADRMPRQLSGGQRQRAGLARALAADPKILLLDEPFGALDPLTRAEMQTMLRDLLSKLRKTGSGGAGGAKTALIVTHDLQEAIFLADRVLFLDAGVIRADLPAREVLASGDPTVREYVQAAQRFEATA